MWLNDNDGWDESPDNSKTNLKVSLILLIGVPIALNVMYYAFAAKYGKLDEEDTEKKSSNGKATGSEKGKKKTKDKEKDSMTKRERRLSSRMDKVKIGRK